MIARKPITIEEHIVGYMEVADRCVARGNEVVPPPASCSPDVIRAANIAAWHPLTIFIIVAFLGMMLSLTWKTFFGGGGHH